MNEETNPIAILCFAVLIGLLGAMFFAKALPMMQHDLAATQGVHHGLY